MSKQNLAVIFGGQSSEHEISCMSASNIIQCIDAQRYNIILVGITKEGHWVEARFGFGNDIYILGLLLNGSA